MRFFVDVTPIGTADLSTVCVDGDSWQVALQAARKLRDDEGPLDGLSVELTDDGCRALDPVARLRYVVREAPATAELTKSGSVAPASAHGTAMRGDRKFGQTAVMPGGPADKTSADAAFALVFSRAMDPDSRSPLTYREDVYVPREAVTEDRAATFLKRRCDELRSHLGRVSRGKLIRLAVLPKDATASQKLTPLVQLVWRDWRGEPEIAFAPREGTRPEALSLSDAEGIEEAKPSQAPAPPPSKPSVAPKPGPTAENARPAAAEQKDAPEKKTAPEKAFPEPAKKAEPVAASKPVGGAPSTEKSAAPSAKASNPPPGAGTISAGKSSPPPGIQALGEMLQKASSPPPAATEDSTQQQANAKPSALATTSPSAPPRPGPSAAPPRPGPSAPPTAAKPEAAASAQANATASGGASTSSAPPPSREMGEGVVVSPIVNISEPPPPVEGPGESVQAIEQPIPAPPKAGVEPIEVIKPEGTTSPAVGTPLTESEPSPAELAKRASDSMRAAGAERARQKISSHQQIEIKPASRISGDELIGTLFEAMHDLHFLGDALEGAAYCLTLLLEHMPLKAAYVLFHDVNRRSFMIARAAGASNAPSACVGHHVEGTDALAKKAVALRRPRVLASADVAAIQEITRIDLVGPVEHVIQVPVVVAGRLLAVFELIDPLDGQPFSETDSNAVGYLAEQYAEFLSARGLILDEKRIRASARA